MCTEYIKEGIENMAVGPRDKIDQLLVKKYAMEKVDNPGLTEFIEPGKMLEVIKDYAEMQRNMMYMQERLQSVCAGVNALSAVYKNRRRIRPS